MKATLPLSEWPENKMKRVKLGYSMPFGKFFQRVFKNNFELICQFQNKNTHILRNNSNGDPRNAQTRICCAPLSELFINGVVIRTRRALLNHNFDMEGIDKYYRVYHQPIDYEVYLGVLFAKKKCIKMSRQRDSRVDCTMPQIRSKLESATHLSSFLKCLKLANALENENKPIIDKKKMLPLPLSSRPLAHSTPNYYWWFNFTILLLTSPHIVIVLVVATHLCLLI